MNIIFVLKKIFLIFKTGGEGIFYTRTKIKFDFDSNKKTGEDENKKEENTVKLENENLSDLDWLKSKINTNLDQKIENKKDEEDGEQNEKQNEDEESNEDKNENKMQDDQEEKEKDDQEDLNQNQAEKDDSSSSSSSEDDEESPNKPKEKESIPIAEQIEDTGRLFIRNLPYSIAEKDIEKLFSKYGELSEVTLPLDNEIKKPKGFAFVQFTIPEKAVTAYAELDGKIWKGRLLHILPGKVLETPAIESKEKSSFKKKKEQKMKEKAQDSVNWNTLFLRSDTVVSATSKKLNISKMDILDPESDNMAVRLALAETNIINDTKKMLESEGVFVERFQYMNDKNVNRSENVILVKNLPFETTNEELRILFGKFGELGRVVLPPSRAIGLVEFLHQQDAKKAFSSLAYKSFKYVPLFLEWPPVEIFKEKLDPKKISAPKNLVNLEENLSTNEEVSNTIYIKNLNFTTTEETLKKAFTKVLENHLIKHINIVKRTETKGNNKGSLISLGYGFIELSNRDAAVKLMKNCQGSIVDGHEIQLKFSTKKKTAPQKSTRKNAENVKPSPKLLVKNLPFQTTKKDVQQLFSNYGQLKSVRIPKKFDKTPRGFCFVEFLTKQEAKNAMDSLVNTHLYGRHLVIEYAKEENSLDEIRERTIKNFKK